MNFLVSARRTRKHIKARTFMTAGTVCEVVCSVAAKRTAAVMTVGTIIAGAVVFAGDDVCDLSALRSTGANRMAFIAANALAF